MVFTRIENYLNGYKNLPKTIKSGRKVNPIHLTELAEKFEEWAMKELLLLACYSDTANPKFILTETKFHTFNGDKEFYAEIINFESIISQVDLSTDEKEILIAVIDIVLKRTTEAKNTLDDFINKYKDLVSQEKTNFSNKDLYFDGKYVELLLHESEEALKICNDLNNDPHFVQSLNLIFVETNLAVDGIKAEHIFLADIIKVYNHIAIHENEKTKFSLAYYFEKLQGNNLAKGISIQRLNELTEKESFNKNIQQIKSSKILQPIAGYDEEFLLPSILYRIDHSLFIKSGNLIYRFASILAKADDTVSEEEKKVLKQILEKTSKPKTKLRNAGTNEISADDSLDKVMEELNSLTGLEDVKKSISDLINFLKIEKIRKEKGLSTPGTSLHCVFSGPPGTGKTTVARLLGRIYKHLGYLEKGHLVETDRAGLVAGYIGQTAIKVDELVKQSIGGVLFIDEAYSLAADNDGRDFGKEAVDALVKRMEDNRNSLVVVVAGYTEPMKIFIESNPGLRSRFNRFFAFDHFLPIQLLDIFKYTCKKNDFELSEDASDKLLDMFELLYEKRDEGFGNGRVVRNIFERCIQNQANRLVSQPEISVEILQKLEEIDIPEPKYMVEQVYFSTNND
jgi:stage V sporulation protein K